MRRMVVGGGGGGGMRGGFVNARAQERGTGVRCESKEVSRQPDTPVSTLVPRCHR